MKVFPWTRRMQFWKPYWKSFARRPKLFCSGYECDEKNFNQIFLLELFLCTRRLQFQKMYKNDELNYLIEFFCTCRREFDKPVETFLMKSRTIFARYRTMRKKNFSRNLLWIFLFLRKMHFRETCWKVLRENQKLSAQCPKLTKKNFRTKNTFASKWFSGHLKCSFYDPNNFFSTKNRKVFAPSPKVFKVLIFHKSSKSH